jgi:hypothetical protein
MKTVVIIVALISAPFLLVPAAAVAQVTHLPYTYDWANAVRLTNTTGGDGNYCASTNIFKGKVFEESGEFEDDDDADVHPSSWKKGWRVSNKHGVSDGPCVRLKPLHKEGAEAYLDLLLNTTAMKFHGEEYEFMIVLKKLPDPGVGTIRIQENSSGRFVTLPDYGERDLSTLPLGPFLQSVSLPPSMAGKPSVTLRIVVKCLRKSTPDIYIDNNRITGSGLPVQLASFGARMLGSTLVQLNWATVSEVNNYGFYVQRRVSGGTSFGDVVNGFVPGNGTTLVPQFYTFTDATVQAGSWEYRLRQVDLEGTSHYSESIQIHILTSVKDGVAVGFDLRQNYPNPFNPETEIQFSVEQSGSATLQVYNALGQEVATLYNDIAQAGTSYTVRWNAASLASGLYYYRLESNGRADLKKMTLLK